MVGKRGRPGKEEGEAKIKKGRRKERESVKQRERQGRRVTLV